MCPFITDPTKCPAQMTQQTCSQDSDCPDSSKCCDCGCVRRCTFVSTDVSGKRCIKRILKVEYRMEKPLFAWIWREISQWLFIEGWKSIQGLSENLGNVTEYYRSEELTISYQPILVFPECNRDNTGRIRANTPNSYIDVFFCLTVP